MAMAAVRILANGVTEILKKLFTVVVKEIVLVTRVKDELEKLQITLSEISSVMTDAEKKQGKDASVKHWMNDINALAYGADDILDKCWYPIMQLSEIRSPRSPLYNKVQNLFSTSSKLNFLFRSMLYNIKDINEEFNIISNRGDLLGLVAFGSSSKTTISDIPETYSHVNASKILIFGRENDKLNIINMLRMDGRGESETVSVISIVGMGGLGKTTLAQLVYNSLSHHNDVNNSDQVEKKIKFDIKMWVAVAQTFYVKNILINITESITKGKCEDVSNFNTVAERLQQLLKGKKFLLVLDDVCNGNQKQWHKLKNQLTVGAVGSKILITTRNDKVASIVTEVFGSKFPPYILKRLHEAECWSIFEHKAFGALGGAAKNAAPNLVAIGKDLSNRCNGLPLAANLLGSLLRNKEEKEWQNIKKSEIWKYDGNGILSIVKLSYDQLSSHLKQCFSYCSIFPKYTEIKRDTLIQLWIAEGFLSQSNETKEMSLEEIGERYFNNLLNNSFFKDVHGYGETLTFRMHDLVHDLAQSVSGNEECLIVAERSVHNMPYISETLRLRLVNLDEEMLAYASDRLNNVRWLRSLFVNQIGISMKIHSVIDNNKQLRVLDLSGTDLESLPPSISNLIHLRYLDLSSTNMKMLPESISKLYNLQTLKLVATKIRPFPKGMEKLINLRHFEYTARKA